MNITGDTGQMIGNIIDSISLAICDAGVNANFKARMQDKRSSEMTISGSHLLFDNTNQILLIQSVKSFEKKPKTVIIPYDALTRILSGDPRGIYRFI